MKRTVIIGGIIVAMAIAILGGVSRNKSSQSVSAQTGGTVQQSVNVSGEGRVSAKPDMGIITAGVSARASTVAEAMNLANQSIEKVRTSLRSNGIDEKDIQTNSINVSPQYSNRTAGDSTPQITGYQASQQLQVKVRDINAIGKVIDDAAAAAGDQFTLSGLRFTIADPTGLQSQAREQAMAKAKVKAEELARLGGLTLGAPIAINEGAQPPTPLLAAPRTGGEFSVASAAPTSVSTGELEIVVTVQVNYSAR